MYLVALDLFDNPLANEPNYRLLCIWTFPSLHVLDRHEVTDEERLAAVKKFGKVSQDLVAFGKRTTKWHNPPPIALASLSATASDMYKELERVRARVEAEEAGKAAREGAAKAEAGEEAGEVLGSKHVRNDYIRVMTWSNPAVEFAAGSSSLQPLQARATATVTASIPAQASSLTITLDQAKYAQCVACAPLVLLMLFAQFVIIFCITTTAAATFTTITSNNVITVVGVVVVFIRQNSHNLSGMNSARLPPTPPPWPPSSCTCDLQAKTCVKDGKQFALMWGIFSSFCRFLLL